MPDAGDLPVIDPEEWSGLERRLLRLQGIAESRHRDFLSARTQWMEVEHFRALAPGTQDLLDDLSKNLFGRILDEIETNLTHAVREILGQEREVSTLREIKNNRLFITFQILNRGEAEDVLVGQGGSVCNILSVGLRLIALSQLDPENHRPFLVLDEQDCWLSPQLVPRLMDIIAAIAKRLELQVLVISHHPLDLLAPRADRVYALRGDREEGVRVERTETGRRDAGEGRRETGEGKRETGNEKRETRNGKREAGRLKSEDRNRQRKRGL